MSTPRSPEQARPPLRSIAVLVLAISHATALAEAADPAAERQRIAAERVQLQARLRETEAACAKQFAVSACVERERNRYHEQLRQLDRQRALVDEAERRQRAAEGQERIRARQLAQAAEADSRAASAVSPRAPRPPPTAVKSTRPPPDPQARAESAQRAASAADSAAARRAHGAARRAQEAAAHRTRIEQRNREREVSKKPLGAPLPVPPAASLPR
jgi:hypothetical protein